MSLITLACVLKALYKALKALFWRLLKKAIAGMIDWLTPVVSVFSVWKSVTAWKLDGFCVMPGAYTVDGGLDNPE